jgi:hypothetical protein
MKLERVIFVRKIFLAIGKTWVYRPRPHEFKTIKNDHVSDHELNANSQYSEPVRFVFVCALHQTAACKSPTHHRLIFHFLGDRLTGLPSASKALGIESGGFFWLRNRILFIAFSSEEGSNAYCDRLLRAKRGRETKTTLFVSA